MNSRNDNPSSEKKDFTDNAREEAMDIEQNTNLSNHSPNDDLDEVKLQD